MVSFKSELWQWRKVILQTSSSIISLSLSDGLVDDQYLCVFCVFSFIGKPVGETILYFGCRKKSEDFLYQEELEGYVTKGALKVIFVFCLPLYCSFIILRKLKITIFKFSFSFMLLSQEIKHKRCMSLISLTKEQMKFGGYLEKIMDTFMFVGEYHSCHSLSIKALHNTIEHLLIHCF